MAKPESTGVPADQGTFKSPDGQPKPKDIQSPDQIIEAQEKRIGQLLKMIDRAHAIITNMAQKIERDGVDNLVMSRNAQGLINQPIEPAEEISR
jgi:hypothetical protein